MYQFTCKCNERCFMRTQTTLIDNILQKKCIYKCNKLKSDKKKPCSFYKEILLKKIPIHSGITCIQCNWINIMGNRYKNIELNQDLCETCYKKIPLIEQNQYMCIDTSSKSDIVLFPPCKKKVKRLTIGDYKIKIQNLLQFYNMLCTNYFGKLNHYLRIVGYSVHIPTIESLEELKLRLTKKPVKLVTNLYINKEIYLSQSFREFNYNREDEETMYNNIINNIDPFEWRKRAIKENKITGPYANYSIVNYLLRKKIIIKPKISKKIKSRNDITPLILPTIEELEEEINSEEEEEEEEGEEKEPVQENQYDIENESDEFDDNNDEEDFSD